jgi:hypothetical protein
MTGHFNPNIVARLNGLADNKHVSGDINVINRLAGVKVELPPGVDIRQVIDIDHKEVK